MVLVDMETPYEHLLPTLTAHGTSLDAIALSVILVLMGLVVYGGLGYVVYKTLREM